MVEGVGFSVVEGFGVVETTVVEGVVEWVEGAVTGAMVVLVVLGSGVVTVTRKVTKDTFLSCAQFDSVEAVKIDGGSQKSST